MSESFAIYNDGRIYDQVFNATRDIPYWQSQLAKVKGRSLELSCGTGRILLELRAQGFAVDGLDLSQGMLDYAAEKAKRRGLQVTLHQGDMRHFQLDQTFAAIYVPNNTLGHLYTLDDIQSHFEAVKAHLQPDGVYMLDMFVPDPAFLMDTPDEKSAIGDYNDPKSDAVVEIYQTGFYDHATQIKHATWSSVCNGQILSEDPFDIRMFYPQELDALIHYNGFEIIAKYGSYDLSPFGATSKLQLIHARVRA